LGYKRQFRFFQPEPDCFVNIPVEMEPEFQILILVPAKPELEIDFCQHSGWNMPEFDREFHEKKERQL
jgi:hypothetical protein